MTACFGIDSVSEWRVSMSLIHDHVINFLMYTLGVYFSTYLNWFLRIQSPGVMQMLCMSQRESEHSCMSPTDCCMLTLLFKGTHRVRIMHYPIRNQAS
jgi:hypothetical protein